MPKLTPLLAAVVAAVAVAGAVRVAPGLANRHALARLHGRVTLSEPPPVVVPRPNVRDLGGGDRPRQPDRRHAVVFFESAPAVGASAAPGRATMDQRDETFVPHVLAIATGTTVDFPNNDRTFHNVFSLSRPRPFDLGRYAAGRSKTVRFERPGIVRVFCDIHSHMNAFILVFDHEFFSATDGQGRYRIDAIPTGTYDVTAWHETLGDQTRRVVVPGGATEVELNFTLGGR